MEGAAAIYAWHPKTRITLYFAAFFILFSIGFILHFLIDAYRSARAWNIQHAAPRIPWWQRILLIAGAVVLVGVVDSGERIERPLALYVIKNIAQAFVVEQYSMEPTLSVGDRVIVDKGIYRRSEPQRGDIIVLRYPRDRSRVYIKRIVALPGETIEFRDERIVINGAPLRTAGAWAARPVPAGAQGPVTIPAGQYFVLGDNTRNSEDSRAFGPVPRIDLLGKAYKIYYPFERSGPLQ